MKNVLGKVDEISLLFKYKFEQSILPFTSKFEPVTPAEGNLFTNTVPPCAFNVKGV